MMRRDVETTIECQLCARIDDLEREKEALAEQLDKAEGESARMRDAVRRARVYAGTNLPAGPGLTVVSMLENAMKEGAR